MMTENQIEFLRLHIIEQENYENIAEMLAVDRSTLSAWYEELKEERLAIAAIRNLWGRKKIKMEFSDFYKWYNSQDRNCLYCEITENEIKELIDTGRLQTKRLATRGKKLELDRKQPDLEYDDFNNLALACYWCNNAKTDTFSEEEFFKVGKVFKDIWKQRLAENKI
ncbi:hypothetical protein [Anditalea andensis]|uniref:HNH domain-containing protein n=1 Tax=Anditalea andensis TaxID=1048983 RepID=A0A074KS06_9BACT|nr:hypothetical protein [Anditalea andensis]KEO71664.1 hypothetical protein EL17_23430 [Anditalea andensis]